MWLREAISCGWRLAFIRLNGKLFRLIIIAQLSLGEKYSLCFWFVLYNFCDFSIKKDRNRLNDLFLFMCLY